MNKHKYKYNAGRRGNKLRSSRSSQGVGIRGRGGGGGGGGYCPHKIWAMSRRGPTFLFRFLKMLGEKLGPKILIFVSQIFFRFRSPDLPFEIRFWTRGSACPLQYKLGIGSSAFRMSLTKHFPSKNFSKFFWNYFVHVSSYPDYEPKIVLFE